VHFQICSNDNNIFTSKCKLTIIAARCQFLYIQICFVSALVRNKCYTSLLKVTLVQLSIVQTLWSHPRVRLSIRAICQLNCRSKYTVISNSGKVWSLPISKIGLTFKHVETQPSRYYAQENI